jgi:uncharacterized iron-regulated membrane protein
VGGAVVSSAMAPSDFFILLATPTLDPRTALRRTFDVVDGHFSVGLVMDQQRTKRVLDFHAWAGVVSALFIYIVSLSGVFALFETELLQWEEPQVQFQTPAQPTALMPLVREYADTLQATGRLASLDVYLPNATRPYYEVIAYWAPEGEQRSKKQTRRWHAQTGQILEPHEDGLTHWLVNFHRSLMLPRTAGRFIVGLSGVLLLVSILSGILLHRKMLKEMFTWRLHRSVRLKWQDSHKILGLWSLPFQLMIAFTGAWLGMIALLLPLNATLTGKWGIEEIYGALFPSGPSAAGISAPMLPLDEVMIATRPHLDNAPQSISIKNWGDQDATYIFLYEPHGTLDGTLRREVNAVTGEIYDVPHIDRSGPIYQVLRSMTTLHYAWFGGGWVKILYTVLGSFLCIIAITGVLIWLEKREHGGKGNAPKAVYTMLGRMTIGTSMGMLIASFAVFYVDRLSTPLPGEKLTTIGIAYLAIWGLGIVFAGVSRNPYRSTKHLLYVTGAVALGIPLLSGLTGSSLLLPVACVDAICAIVGLLLIGVGVKLKPHRA